MRKLLALLLCLWLTPASAAIVALNGTVPVSGSSFAFDQNGSSYYFPVMGIYGIAGDYEADVDSGHHLLVTGSVTAASGAFALNSIATGAMVDWGAIASITQYSGTSQPSSFGGLLWGIYEQSAQTATNSGNPLSAQTTAAVPTGGGVICDKASTANPCAPAATVKAASTSAASTDTGLVVRSIQNPDPSNISATGAAPPANAAYQGALTGGATGGYQQGLISCNSHTYQHITSATNTLFVQGVASQTVYICGWRSRAAGTATWYLANTASANANCSSTLTQITGLASEVVNSGETLLAAFWTGLKNTSGNGLCAVSTGTGGVDIDLWYTQF